MTHLTFITLYLLALIGVGAYKAGKIKTQEDFAVAGRSLTPWILVGTMMATWMGTGSILGNAGKTYMTGMAALILPIGGVVGIAFLTRIAGKVRSFNKFTVPEIIGDRYGSTARLLSVVALVMAYMVIVSYQYNAGGAVLFTVLQDSAGNPMITEETGTIIAALFIITYTVLAGLVSVAYTDVVNGIIMMVTFLIAFPLLWIKAGGADGMTASFISMGKPEHMQFFGVYSTIDIINFCLPPFLLVMGDANMYQRFFASKNAEGAKSATTVLIFAVAIMELLIIATAWVSASLIPDAEVGKYVLIYAAHQLLPTFLGAVMMTTIVGIILSTADSFLLVPATTLMKDVYLEYINPKANQKKIVFLSRMLVLVLGIVAYIVSLGFAKSAGFFERALYAYTIYGAAITPSLVAALFWKGATKEGAVASILSGTFITLLWKELPSLWTWVPAHIYGSVDEVLPAISASLFALISVSLLTKKN
ncbi:MAG: sodium:solute symporter family protein [Candidatus Marinimicrobia bacterium]|jgi:SSS family transporter|nr:sodium:solute symporter family protein [Candidatus Neomarinimicrobiota bacterium]MBT3618648.1 sodium:solute symporter family protein [Candidatus Neomarinimicrobiota bacterium]MBT3829680.1 sodium:solute symporter family protein [Candidatus Neomarinimicrobiota bacterium]MBT3997397.1 sodium:solute symporter family protein [Candidatus Neomarinimicrobiota bacterium]MBT4280454.1 sodium:solute symporter family protein [Candidatus Neomarinimicrobiota bacterium]